MSNIDLQLSPERWENRVRRVAVRSQANVERSLAVIVRSRQLVSGELDVFHSPAPDLTDEQLVAVADCHHATVHQREIEREVRQTLRRSDFSD